MSKARKSNEVDDRWQKFLDRDAHLNKLQEESVEYWLANKHDPALEAAALEKIEKELNVEINKVSAEVNQLLREYHESKGEPASALDASVERDVEVELEIEDAGGSPRGSETEDEENPSSEQN